MKPNLNRIFAALCCCTLLVCSAIAQTNNTNTAAELNITLGEQRVRFAPTRSFQEMHLEVLNSVGETVFTYTTTSAEYDWNLRSGNGEALTPGLYRYTLALKYSEDVTHRHQGHFIVEQGQDRIWLTAQDGAEVSGAALNAARSGGRSIAGFRTAENKQPERAVSGRDLIDENGNKLTDTSKATKQEKANILGTLNRLAKFGAGGAADTDSGVRENASGHLGFGVDSSAATPLLFNGDINPGLSSGLPALMLQSNSDRARIEMRQAGSGAPIVQGRSAGGTLAAPTASPVNQILGGFGGSGHDGLSYAALSHGFIGIRAGQNWSASAKGTYLTFDTTPNGTITRLERMRISDAGNVGVGTSTPNRKLTVQTGADFGLSHTNGTVEVGTFVNSFGGWLQTHTNHSLFFTTNNGGAQMALTTAGNFGIGTITPERKLHVVGSFGGSLIRADNSDPDGEGVFGQVTSTASGTGSGVAGSHAGGGNGVSGDSITGIGVQGLSFGATGIGVLGVAQSSTGLNYGVVGRTLSTTTGASGVAGEANGAIGETNGVYGKSISSIGNGVKGVVTSTGVGAFAIFGMATAPARAGYFNGNVQVTGTLSKGGGAFKIDHPLDPANKYLSHSFVESPDMMNLYNGNVTTDNLGEAEVSLPEWFEALNKDFRYQLTAIGQFAQAIVAEKIKGDHFKIRTSLPNVEVSWQVTGIRQDAFANTNRIPVEEDKPEAERGSYLHPEAFGKEEEMGVEWKLRPAAMTQFKADREQTRRRVAGEPVQEEKALSPAPPDRPVKQP